jgi:hypothetical protein
LQRAVHVFEEVFQQLIRVLEFIRHAFVGDMAVFVIERQASAGIFEFLRWSDCMCVVISQNAFAVRFVERQCVTNAMRDVFAGAYAPRVDLDPVAVTLVDDDAVQVEQGVESDDVPGGNCITW